MMGRHELREQVFRLLFRVEFHSAEEMAEQTVLFEDDLPAEDTEKSMREKEVAYIKDRCDNIRIKIAEVDKLINDNTEGWDTTRMGKVELSALRVAVYEMMFDEEIPASVAINEAVEIAKKYGQESSGAFVNAILGKISKLGESNS